MQIARVTQVWFQADSLPWAKEFANSNGLALFVREVGRLQLRDIGPADDPDAEPMVPGALVEGAVLVPNRYLPDEQDVELTVWGGGEMFNIAAHVDAEIAASFGSFDESAADLPASTLCGRCNRSLFPGVPNRDFHVGC